PCLPGVLAVHRPGAEPDPHPTVRRVRHHRALALDRTAGARQPPRHAAATAAVLSALAGRTGQRKLLAFGVEPDQPVERAGRTHRPRPAAVPASVAGRTGCSGNTPR